MEIIFEKLFRKPKKANSLGIIAQKQTKAEPSSTGCFFISDQPPYCVEGGCQYLMENFPRNRVLSALSLQCSPWYWGALQGELMFSLPDTTLLLAQSATNSQRGRLYRTDRISTRYIRRSRTHIAFVELVLLPRAPKVQKVKKPKINMWVEKARRVCWMCIYFRHRPEGKCEV